MNKTTKIFNNPVASSVQKKAASQKKKFAKKFAYDPAADYRLTAVPDEVLYKPLGIKKLVMGTEGEPVDSKRSIILGTLKAGYGRYRISMAAASAAKSMGVTPYWLDLMSYENTPGERMAEHFNIKHSPGLKLSQKSKIFNRLYWKPFTEDSSRKLAHNVSGREICGLISQIYRSLSDEIPVAASHAWAALAALDAGMKRVVNMMPDNYPLGVHLAEGSIHTVQTPAAYLGCMTLKNMDKTGTPLNPMPLSDIKNTGHYIDHELVSNIEKDCDMRIRRSEMGSAVRVLLPVGAAGADREIAALIIQKMAPLLKEGGAALFINAGDQSHEAAFFKRELENNNVVFKNHTDWNETAEFAKQHTTGHVEGAHIFFSQNIFSAVYTTNLLMRCCDFMITEPGELAYYPVPKLMTRSAGRHEAMGAIRSSELGDGTIECETPGLVLQMLDLMINEKSIVKMMCKNIVKQKKIGTYNGAYNVINLAMKKSRM